MIAGTDVRNINICAIKLKRIGVRKFNSGIRMVVDLQKYKFIISYIQPEYFILILKTCCIIKRKLLFKMQNNQNDQHP